jgi:hypothetical protein
LSCTRRKRFLSAVRVLLQPDTRLAEFAAVKGVVNDDAVVPVPFDLGATDALLPFECVLDQIADRQDVNAGHART